MLMSAITGFYGINLEYPWIVIDTNNFILGDQIHTKIKLYVLNFTF